MSETPAQPAWDEQAAQSMIGKTVLVGLRYAARPGQPERMIEYHGRVVEVDRRRGIHLSLQGVHEGEDYWLPPQITNLHAAAPGSYRLRSTGEVVDDPDFTTQWTVEPPAQ